MMLFRFQRLIVWILLGASPLLAWGETPTTHPAPEDRATANETPAGQEETPSKPETEASYRLTAPKLELSLPAQTEQVPWPPRGKSQKQELPASLLALLQSQDPEIRVRAVEGLAASESYDALQWLILSLGDSAPEVRKAASQAILQGNPAWLVDSILGTLLAGSPETANALDSVLPSLARVIEPTLLHLFREQGQPEPYLIVMAYALGRIKSHESIKDLAKYAKSGQRELAEVCANALYEVDDEGAIRELTGLLESPYIEVRRTALYGLIRLGGPEVLSTLMDISSGKKESDLQLRQEATALLAYVGDEKTIEYLVGLIRQQSGLGNAASFALQNLTGYQVGNRPYLWLEWWNELQEAKKLEQEEKMTNPLVPADQIPEEEQGHFPGLPPVGVPRPEDTVEQR
ncbi:MAG: HEAT repeat domain-containing protein [Candidatus Hydrogenedentes bacterium]|nr:HEAT repeat domain-containing protein [Candidatus Hydrogenedentota bacterium]